MRITVIQEIVDQENHLIGHLYRHLELDFVPDSGMALQFEDGYKCMPIYTVYDVPTSNVYVIDAVQSIFLGNCEFLEFLKEHRRNGWRFKEDIYESEESMRIEIP